MPFCGVVKSALLQAVSHVCHIRHQVKTLRELSHSVVSHYYWGSSNSSGVQTKHVRVSMPLTNSAGFFSCCDRSRLLAQAPPSLPVPPGMPKRLALVPNTSSAQLNAMRLRALANPHASTWQ